MTVPTIACLLLGGRDQRPLGPPAASSLQRPRRAPSSSALLAALSIAARFRSRCSSCSSRSTASARRSSRRLSRRSSRTSCPRRSRRRRTHSTSSCARSRCASSGRRSEDGSSRWLGAGSAFALDAASFAVSGSGSFSYCEPRGRPRGRRPRPCGDRGRLPLRAPERLALGDPASAAIAYLAFLGPTEALLPYLVKNELHGSASDLGLVFAAGGIGAVGAAALMAQRGHPRRDMTSMYACWTLATLAVAGYGLHGPRPS